MRTWPAANRSGSSVYIQGQHLRVETLTVPNQGTEWNNLSDMKYYRYKPDWHSNSHILTR